MLLAFDIGNTNIVVGCFDETTLLREFRLKTDLRRTIDEYAVLVKSFIDEENRKTGSKLQAVVCSVVPPLTARFVALLKKHFDIEALVVGPGVKTGLALKTSDPTAVGADRIVNAIAAKELYGIPALVIDFGTATSFDYVDADSNYCGGLILPGMEVSLSALVEKTAKLPEIDLDWPETVIGRDTTSAMQSGTLLGYHCMIDGLISKVIEEVGDISNIIATGGLGELLAEKSIKISAYDPHLTLRGIAILAKLNNM